MQRSQTRAALVALAMLCLLGGEARADRTLGVDVYPGAQLLAAKTAQMRAIVGPDASCYNTVDGMPAVTAFYIGRDGFTNVGGNVPRRDTVDVVLHDGGTYTDFCIMPSMP